MDTSVARKLASLNTRFYASQASGFSATRRASWAGWDAVLDVCDMVRVPAKVLDVACGNMRFASFLSQRYPGASIAYIGVDNCAALACDSRDEAGGAGCIERSFAERDIVMSLIDGVPLRLPAADLVACFGFMHHVPAARNREALLVQLLDSVASGGVLAVSFWQFMQAGSIAAQARELTPASLEALGIDQTQLEEGDYLLGWQNKPDARRYCHSFDACQVTQLTQSALERAAGRFETGFIEADGRNGRFNRYLIARRLE